MASSFLIGFLEVSALEVGGKHGDLLLATFATFFEFVKPTKLGGGFKYFLFSSLFGEDFPFD